MKILSLILLFICVNTYAQEQKYVDMSNMRQFNFEQCNGIDGNNIPNLSRNAHTAENCQQVYLKTDICTIEAKRLKKALANTQQCDSWLKVRTRGCKKFIKREATKCGGKGKYSKNNFFNPQAKTHTGLLKTKDILAYSESEQKIEKQRIIVAEQERQRKIAVKQKSQRLAKLQQEREEEEEEEEERELALLKQQRQTTQNSILSNLATIIDTYAQYKQAKSGNSYVPTVSSYTPPVRTYTPPVSTYKSTSNNNSGGHYIKVPDALKCIEFSYKTHFGELVRYTKNKCSFPILYWYCYIGADAFGCDKDYAGGHFNHYNVLKPYENNRTVSSYSKYKIHYFACRGDIGISTILYNDKKWATKFSCQKWIDQEKPSQRAIR